MIPLVRLAYLARRLDLEAYGSVEFIVDLIRKIAEKQKYSRYPGGLVIHE